LARGAAASGAVPGRRRPERAASRTGAGAPDHGHAPDAGGGVLPALLPEARRGGGGARARRPGQHPAPALLDLRRCAARGSPRTGAARGRPAERRGGSRPPAGLAHGSGRRRLHARVRADRVPGGLNWYRNIDRNWGLLAYGPVRRKKTLDASVPCGWVKTASVSCPLVARPT